MHGFHDLCGCPPEPVNPGRDKDGGSAQSVGAPPLGHPRPVHGLDEPYSRIFNLLKLISELQPAAETIDEKTGIDDELLLVFLLEQDFIAENFEYFGYLKHVHLDGVGKIDQQVWALVDATGDVEAGSRHNFRISSLG